MVYKHRMKNGKIRTYKSKRVYEESMKGMFANQYQRKDHSKKIAKSKKKRRLQHLGVGKISSKGEYCKYCRKKKHLTEGRCKDCAEAFASYKQEPLNQTPRQKMLADLENIADLKEEDIKIIENSYNIKFDPEEHKISFTGRGHGSNSWLLTINGNSFIIFSDYGSAKEEAIQEAALLIEGEPLNFDLNILARHLSMTDADIRMEAKHEAEESYMWEAYSVEDLKHRFGIGWNETRSKEQLIEEAIEKEYKRIKQELEEDPHQYYVTDTGYYTTKNLINQKWIKIDYEEAAKDVVDIEGVVPFIASFDGEEVVTPNDFYVYRVE